MKFMKKILLASTLLFSILGFTSLSANAALVTQDLEITIGFAAGGNAFGVSSGDVFTGFFQYDPAKLGAGGVLDSAFDPSMDFELSFGSLTLTGADALFAFGGGVADPLKSLSGLGLFIADFALSGGVLGSVNAAAAFDTNEVLFADANFAPIFTADISFGNLVAVSEPSVFALFMMGLALVARRRIVAK